MYGVSYSGALYKVNPVTGLCSFIGELDYNPDQAYMYNNNCLFFDNETGNYISASSLSMERNMSCPKSI